MLWGVAGGALGLGGREGMWGSQEDGLAGSVQNQEQDGGARRGGREGTVLEHSHSLKSPNPVGRHMGEPHFYR